MSSAAMHENEPAMDVALVRRMLAGQFPQWAALPIERFDSTGTTNWIYRLGDRLAIRLPRVGYGEAQVRKERALNVHVPPGVETGTRIRLAGEGESGPRGGAPGDLYIFIDLVIITNCI